MSDPLLRVLCPSKSNYLLTLNLRFGRRLGLGLSLGFLWFGLRLNDLLEIFLHGQTVHVVHNVAQLLSEHDQILDDDV